MTDKAGGGEVSQLRDKGARGRGDFSGQPALLTGLLRRPPPFSVAFFFFSLFFFWGAGQDEPGRGSRGGSWRLRPRVGDPRPATRRL